MVKTSRFQCKGHRFDPWERKFCVAWPEKHEGRFSLKAVQEYVCGMLGSFSFLRGKKQDVSALIRRFQK